MTTQAETFWTLEHADHYGISLVKARHFTAEEKTKFAEWFRDLGMYSVGEHIDLPFLTWRDHPERTSDGAFCGCDNRAWTVSPDEMQQYIALNNERKAAKEAKDAAALAAVEAKRISIFAAAKQAGEPKELDRWLSNDCLDNLTDCSFDVVILLAMPDGTTKHEHTHCF